MNNEKIINNIIEMIRWRQNLKSFNNNKYMFNCLYSEYVSFEESDISYNVNNNIIDVVVNNNIFKSIVFEKNTEDILNYNNEKYIFITNDIKLINKFITKHKKSTSNFVLKCELFNKKDFEVDISKSSYFNFILPFDKNKYEEYKNDVSLINIEEEFLLRYFNIKKDELICIIPLFNSLSFCSYIKLAR